MLCRLKILFDKRTQIGLVKLSVKLNELLRGKRIESGKTFNYVVCGDDESCPERERERDHL